MSNGFHKISYQDAKDFILRFISQDDLYPIASSKALGGTMLKETFETEFKAEYLGSIGWFCFNYHDEPNYPGFFLAFETAERVYDTSSPPPAAIVSATLYYTNDIFTYSLQSTMANVDYFLRNQIQICGDLLTIDSSTASRFEKFFRNKFPAGIANPHNKYGCVFFEKTALEEFIDQGPYVRYYFGYDNNPAQEQKIRVILFSVDRFGKNIINDPADPSKDAIILERHWPPS